MGVVSSPMVFSLSESMVHAVSRLVDDWQNPREPTHSDIGVTLARAGLADADPHADTNAPKVGKQKRVRQALQWALDNDETAGTRGVEAVISLVRGSGGFLPNSPNYCGDDAIRTCVAAFEGEPVELTLDGVLRSRNLSILSGRELSEALRSYVLRAQRGHEDSVLLVGTSKDIIEAAAAHVVTERYGSYSDQADFPTLLGQAFVAVGLDAQRPRQESGGVDGARTALSVALYELACAVNRVRNRGGSGHGRPFLPELTREEVRAATEAAGLVAGRLLDALDSA
jgi:hypothetical protein